MFSIPMFPPALILAAALSAQPGLEKPAASSAAQPAAVPSTSILDLAAQRMSPIGRQAFQNFVRRTLLVKVRADGEAQVRYRRALGTLVAAQPLDLPAIEREIAARRSAEAALASEIRTSAFAMIATLPPTDRKLALTAIFYDTRQPTHSVPSVSTPGTAG